MMTNDLPSGLPTTLAAGQLMGANLNSAALSSTVASAGQLSGALICVMFNTGATPGTYTTRTAVQMIADNTPALQINQTWLILLGNNQGTGTLTLAGGTGVTAGGTLTVAPNVMRVFKAIVTADTTITITGQALSWTIAA